MSTTTKTETETSYVTPFIIIWSIATVIIFGALAAMSNGILSETGMNITGLIAFGGAFLGSFFFIGKMLNN